MSIKLFIMLIWALVALLFATTGTFYSIISWKKYKAEPKARQNAQKERIQNDAIKALNTAKSLAKVEIYNVAKDPNLVSGPAKMHKAVQLVQYFLSNCHLTLPEITILHVIESVYQQDKGDIKAKGIDSRQNSTPTPDQMDKEELKKRLP